MPLVVLDLTKHVGKELGLSGQGLLDFVDSKEKLAREERIRVTEDKQRELEIVEKQIAFENVRKENATLTGDRKSRHSHNHSLTKPPIKVASFVEGKDNY